MPTFRRLQVDSVSYLIRSRHPVPPTEGDILDLFFWFHEPLYLFIYLMSLPLISLLVMAASNATAIMSLLLVESPRARGTERPDEMERNL